MNNKVNTTGKSLRKAALKSIIALVLCMATIFGSIGTGANKANAAKKKVPMAVTFNGKTINLINDLKTSQGRGDGDSPKISEVQKKWGKPNKKKKTGDVTTYIWKKGKSSIQIDDCETSNGQVGGINISIKDKNASVFGVKVGMKKAIAAKKLKSATGKQVLLEPSGDSYTPFTFILKNGKVSEISFYRS